MIARSTNYSHPYTCLSTPLNSRQIQTIGPTVSCWWATLPANWSHDESPCARRWSWHKLCPAQASPQEHSKEPRACASHSNAKSQPERQPSRTNTNQKSRRHWRNGALQLVRIGPKKLASEVLVPRNSTENSERSEPRAGCDSWLWLKHQVSVGVTVLNSSCHWPRWPVLGRIQHQPSLLAKGGAKGAWPWRPWWPHYRSMWGKDINPNYKATDGIK